MVFPKFIGLIVALHILSGCATLTHFENGYVAHLDRPVDPCPALKIKDFREQIEKDLLQKKLVKNLAYFERRQQHFVDTFTFPSGDKDTPSRILVIEFNSLNCNYELSDVGDTKRSVDDKRANSEGIALRMNEIYRSVFSQTPKIRKSYE